MYLSLYRLGRDECRRLRVYDTYGCHRVIYDLFDRTRADDDNSHSGILFADRGTRNLVREILVLSDREPRIPSIGSLETKFLPPEWLDCPAYRFEITVNPVFRKFVKNGTGRLEAIRGREAIGKWFMDKAPGWGFAVVEDTLQVNEIHVDIFQKGDSRVTMEKASVTGWLTVVDRERFGKSATRGIGRGRAFGCGLLQIIPGVLPENL